MLAFYPTNYNMRLAILAWVVITLMVLAFWLLNHIVWKAKTRSRIVWLLIGNLDQLDRNDPWIVHSMESALVKVGAFVLRSQTVGDGVCLKLELVDPNVGVHEVVELLRGMGFEVEEV